MRFIILPSYYYIILYVTLTEIKVVWLDMYNIVKNKTQKIKGGERDGRSF